MKKLIITSLSALALAMAFTGCGEGSVSSDATSSSTPSNANTSTPLVVDNGDTAQTTITNEFGLNPELGTPPPLPGS